ncbi:flagellar hook-associated protein FlgL [Armatimonas sp.]|uniref:flagellar hook-associated protein FlgL n=1 Tax=Armatimonas sp. TaxID=1872638 RepID=UPI00286A07FB|nr:flagellar hook-associated protein FlgL [Armatimonas sp.]
MRITTWMTHQQRLANLQSTEARLNKAQNQVSSGRKLERTSDNPTGAVELLTIQTRLTEREQQGASIKGALPLMKATESSLGDISNALLSARNAALRAANTATGSDADRAALAAQIQAAKRTVLQQANLKVDQRYLYSGTKSDVQPFTGDSVTYAGNTRALKIDVTDGNPIEISVTGEQIRGGQAGSDLFANLTALEQAVRAGDSAAIRVGIDKLDGDRDRVINLRGDMGSRLNYLEMAQDGIDKEVILLQTRQSDLRDVDLAEAIVTAKLAENGQQAALAMASKIGGMSLLDYLR